MLIEVTRGAGDRQGPDITDALLVTEAAARERGRQEIERYSTSRELVTVAGPLAEWLQPGMLVEVADGQTAAWRGLLLACTLRLARDDDGLTAETTLELEREP